MPDHYGELYQNYAAGSGTNGEYVNVASSTANADDSMSTGHATPKSGLRARLILPDRPESREKVHRIRVMAASDGDVDMRRDRALCILGCCGRGRLMILWTVSGPIFSRHSKRVSSYFFGPTY